MSQAIQGKATSPVRVGVREFRGNITEYLRQVRDGASFLITLRDEIVAELHPPSPEPPRRLIGAMRGQIRMSDDFDHLLIAQAISENAALMSDDRNMPKYPVQVIG